MACVCRWRSCSTCRACCRLSLQHWSLSSLQMPTTLARHCDVPGRHVVGAIRCRQIFQHQVAVDVTIESCNSIQFRQTNACEVGNLQNSGSRFDNWTAACGPKLSMLFAYLDVCASLSVCLTAPTMSTILCSMSEPSMRSKHRVRGMAISTVSVHQFIGMRIGDILQR
jgi:hypothetical protein